MLKFIYEVLSTTCVRSAENIFVLFIYTCMTALTALDVHVTCYSLRSVVTKIIQRLPCLVLQAFFKKCNS